MGFLKILLCALIALAVAASTNAQVCCQCSDQINGVCADGRACGVAHWPQLCCGAENCTPHPFCCKCPGPCITSSTVAKWNSTVNGFKKLDNDFSGDIDLKEFYNYFVTNKIPQAVLINFVFKSVDKNQDGHISPKEMNAAN